MGHGSCRRGVTIEGIASRGKVLRDATTEGEDFANKCWLKTSFYVFVSEDISYPGPTLSGLDLTYSNEHDVTGRSMPAVFFASQGPAVFFIVGYIVTVVCIVSWR